ncbi:hypothetical protein LO763_20015 [Glycomyces sp. A-F 0318]|uniref:hypothetical protein n=1 Tax=Glycomyces amatae TaxID=2881355 RepID=UPI001E434CAA|nr:hypothetical protein [Glycomyces amatae]MCD0445900.1 hypothetical protein [Glycomyces amatae]
MTDTPLPPAEKKTRSNGDQPRWAWWMAGIAIPTIGILVSVLLTLGSNSEQNGTVTDDSAAGGTEAEGDPAEEASSLASSSHEPSSPESGSTNDSGSPYELAQSDVPLTIQAPTGYAPVAAAGGCGNSARTRIDFDNLIVDTTGNAEITAAMRYQNCGEETSRLAIEMYDGNRMGASSIEEPNVEECLQAARSGNLPNPITVEQIQNDSVLVKDMRLCIETEAGTVVLLHITDVQAVESGGDRTLRTYTTTATQWTLSYPVGE